MQALSQLSYTPVRVTLNTELLVAKSLLRQQIC